MTETFTTTQSRVQHPVNTDFVNAQEMHLLNPETFDVPSEAELAAIKPGDSVKVCTGGERFWVSVTVASESMIAGTVDNQLVYTDRHGLRIGDTIHFSRECVYDVM